MTIKEKEKTKMDYWMKRLDHSVDHIQQSSKLVYMVDGAVLAFVYFLIGMFHSRLAIFWISFIFLLLAVINYLHSEFIRHMNNTYKNISDRLLVIVGEKSEHSWPRGFLVIKWDIYRLIHIIIALALLVVFILMFLYGVGCFSELNF